MAGKKALTPNEVLSGEVKSNEAEKLKSVFGKTLVTWDECLKEILTAVSNKDSHKLKSIMDLDIFDEPQFWTNENFQTVKNIMLLHVLDCKWYKPIEVACSLPSSECLKLLLPVWQNVWQMKDRWFRLLWSGLVTCILKMNEEPVHEFDEYIKCIKLLISYGTHVWNNDSWSVLDFENSLKRTTQHIEILYAAGLPFEVYEEDRDISGIDFTGFLSYLESKCYPKKDENGLYHVGLLKNICRDEIRHRVIKDGWSPNIFYFTKEMVDGGHLTLADAKFLVYGLYNAVFDYVRQ